MPITSKAGTIHYDKLLSQYAADYQPQLYKFINQFILPSVVVEKQSDLYAKFSALGKFDIKNTIRAKGTQATKVNTFSFSDTAYYCYERALKEEIFLQDIVNADDIIDEEKRKTFNIMNLLLLEKEYNAANLVFTSTNYTSGATKSTTPCATKWDTDNYETVNPRTEVLAYKRLISKRIGIEPNTLIFNDTVADGLMESPFIQSYLSSNAEKNIDAAVLARFFKVENVLIGKSAYNTAKEGQTITVGGIWGKHALLCYVNPSTSKEDASFGKTFLWNGMGNAATQDRGIVGVRKWKDDGTKTNYVEAELNYDQKITFEDSAFLITDVIS